MKLAKRTQRAIDALVYIGRRGELVTMQDMNRALGQRGNTWLPVPALLRAGILSSKVGRHGGFVLAQPMDEVTLMDIVTATEGPLFPVARDWTKASKLASAHLFDVMSRHMCKITLAQLAKGSVVA